MYREHKHSHIEWPDRTLQFYMPCMTFTILDHPCWVISLRSGTQRFTATKYHKCNALHDLYNLGPPLLGDIPAFRYAEVHCNQIPQMQCRHQQLKNITSPRGGQS